MKLRLKNSRPQGGGPAAGGFTLTEIMVATAILVIVVGGIMSAHVFGLRMLQVNTTTLTATAWTRNVFGRLANEVRSSSGLLVGNLDTTNTALPTFDELLNGEPQQGNALMIFPTTNTSNYIFYYVNPADQTFRRITDQSGSALILAYQITNSVVFTAKDYSGNLLTSSANSNNPVIHLTLDVDQPPMYLQNGYGYQLKTSMTRRASQ